MYHILDYNIEMSIFLLCDNGIFVIWENVLILRGYILKYLGVTCHDVCTLLENNANTHTYTHTKRQGMHKCDKTLTISESRWKVYRHSWYYIVYFSIGLKFFQNKKLRGACVNAWKSSSSEWHWVHALFYSFPLLQ